MRKGLKKLIVTAMAGLIIVGNFTINASADTTTIKERVNKTIESNEILDEMSSKFPDLRKHLEEYTTGELAGSEETYVKFTKKPNVKLKDEYTMETLQEDIDISYHTKEEYLKEKDARYESTNETSWLRISAQVFKSQFVQFMAYNFSSWLRSPFFKLKDAIGLTVGEGVIIGRDNVPGRMAQYACGSIKNNYVNNLNLTVNSKGALAEAYINQSISGWQGEYHDFMMAVNVEFNNSSTTAGRLDATYNHKEIGVGGISLSPTGFPSVSIGSKYSKAEASVHFYR